MAVNQSINQSLKYYNLIIFFILAPNNYHTSFEIDENTAKIRQVKDVLNTNLLTIVVSINPMLQRIYLSKPDFYAIIKTHI